MPKTTGESNSILRFMVEKNERPANRFNCTGVELKEKVKIQLVQTAHKQ